ncbi:crinkler family protein [Gigaspora margarita]|uniref:Crinkler family protein n=1 Tax=Gigaspora margarita TaxID=4874 RepID=A0A8H3X970_GIGMA|nr:crinkler family protein [Gigaspora margarita]
MDVITLNCLVEGDDPYDNCFEVEINKTKNVSTLKKAIKNEKTPDFDNFVTNKLKLWKVDVSLLRSNKKLDVLVSKEYAVIEQKLEGTKLLASNEIQYYFNEQPTKKYIHIIVERLPGPTITSSREDELLSEIALLKAQIVKSEHKFEIIVHPKRKEKLMWTVNVDHASLDGLKKIIYDKYKTPALENDYAVFEFTCDSIRYTPRDDGAFRGMLRQLISENINLFTVFIETPSKPFADWTLPQICQLYGIGEQGNASITEFPYFMCGCKELNDDSSQKIFKTLMNNLNLFYKYTHIHSNEASKSLYVYLYLVAGASLQNGQFRIDPQFNIIGPNGHGPVDYAIRASEYLKIVGVKKSQTRKIGKGIAQNAVQIESVLANRKRKFDEMQREDTFRDRVVGIVTDAITWFFLECSYDDQERPNFKLSNSITVDYNNDRMEYDVKRILGHISWLLEEVQKPVDDFKSEGSETKRLKSSVTSDK